MQTIFVSQRTNMASRHLHNQLQQIVCDLSQSALPSRHPICALSALPSGVFVMINLRQKCVLAVITISLAGHASAITPSGCEDIGAQPVRFGVGFDEIYNNIIAVRCANCHTNGGSSGGMALPDANLAFTRLINVLPVNAAAQDVVRVKPNDTSNSFVYLKVNCATPGAGSRMPRNGPPFLTLADQALIYDWIDQGANRNADPDVVFQAKFEVRF
jgi:hypothetical protein